MIRKDELMSTKQNFQRARITNENKLFSPLRSIVETAFYGNNVVEINDLQTAYDMACQSPGTVITDLDVYKPEHLGLKEGAKVLLFNGGSVTGRAAAARRIIGNEGVDESDLNKKVMDAIYATRKMKLYHAQTVIGLQEDFMVHAHLLIPEGEENLLYNWMLNFQPLTEKYQEMYKRSQHLPETDIYVFSFPEWAHPDHPLGLTYFDTQHNCAALLGMEYFGEHKKGTLTLAWAIADRNGYASCHGGAKTIYSGSHPPYTLAVFGLSGSGKSTLTHAQHDGKYKIRILHDDAYIINVKEKYAIALEPTYFDKLQDYPTNHPANKYLLTMQNVGITLDARGNKVPVTQDIRNGNGRAIKSRLWSPNRVDRLDDPITAIAWIQKDPVLPPILRIKDPVMGSLMGATLSTKRTSAERLAKGIDPNQLVIEPYANPFRTYPLSNDFEKFLELIKDGVTCYVLNTGYFQDRKIPKEMTIHIIETLVEEKDQWKPWVIEGMDYMPIEKFEPDVKDANYQADVRESFSKRLQFINDLSAYNQLPPIASEKLKEIVDALKWQRFH